MAVTGRGDFPFRSAWLGGRRKQGATPRKITVNSYDSAYSLVWTDFAFDAAASGAISGTSTVAFTTSGNLTGAGALSGSTAPTFTTAGILRGSARAPLTLGTPICHEWPL